MQTITLGRTGLRTTIAGLGCGGYSRLGQPKFGTDHAAKIVRHAYDSGVNFFDTATVYGTQDAVGLGLAGVPRDSYILSTKFPYWDWHEERLRPAQEIEDFVDESLREMRTDYIDIYHLHGVSPDAYTYAREEYYPVLLRLRDLGKIRFIGITEGFGGDTSHRMLDVALEDDLWDVVMVGCNIINPSAAQTILPRTIAKNIGVLCMFAVRTALSNPDKLREELRKMADAGQYESDMQHPLDFLVENGYASSIMEAAYRYCCHTPGIHVTLTGTGDLSHLDHNLRSIAMPSLPDPALSKLHNLFGQVDCVSGN